MTNTAIRLTACQSKAIQEMKQFVSLDCHENMFRLTGYAGTGKTFVICQFIQWLIENNYSVIACSPTNKAAKNLKAMASESNLDIDVTTIAKLLKQQAEINPETGKEVFVNQDDIDLTLYDVIIADEFSMISENNFTSLAIELEGNTRTKIIFVGDSAQLPPVGESRPIVEISVKKSVKLETVVRYDGELAQAAERIRNNKVFDKKIYPFKTTQDESIVVSERWEWLQKAASLFNSQDFKDNPNYVRFLVWRNKQADALNAFVRKELWGETAPRFVAGDRLIAKTPVFRSIITMKGRKEVEQWNTVMSASEECVVIEEGKATVDKQYGFPCYQVRVITDDGLKLDLQILTEEGKHEQKEFLLDIKSKARNLHGRQKSVIWKLYYTCLKTFDNVPYAYAITTHKAQGSTLDYAFVDTMDIRNCPDLQKILYTALTRAKKQVFIPD